MPLLKGKKNIGHNIAVEEKAGKPHTQSIAIALSVARKPKKKNLADGGKVNPQPSPSPDPSAKAKKILAPVKKYVDEHTDGGNGYYDGGMVDTNDRGSIRRNSADHAPMRGDDAKTQGDTSYQARKGLKTTKIKHPKMVASNVVQSRLRDEEDDLMDSFPPSSPTDQPPKADNEMRPDRQGPKVPDEEREHSNGHKPHLAKGGMINYEVPMSEAEEDHAEHPAGLEEDNDQMRPSKEMYMSGEMPGKMAEGGRAGAQDIDEEEIEHAASLAAAIMMKRKKMARGGAILSEDSMETTDADQADMARNAEEDANMEDKASFDALRKENYSESDGLELMDSPVDSNEHEPEHEEMDVHDKSVVSQIRSKMKKKSAITR